jgi:hypothetical protein
MLTTEGITFSSMGARLGNGWLGEDETEEDVSAAKALTGVSAMPRLSARALNINEVFFILVSHNDGYTDHCCGRMLR